MSRVVYVEDEEDYQRLVRKILARGGINVDIAPTGEQGWRAIEEAPPQLIILDVNLPDTDGYRLCQRLRASSVASALPVLMLTVRRRPDEWLQGFAVGANDYVPKPLDPEHLLARVQAGLAKGGTGLAGQSAATPEFQLIQASVQGNRCAFEVLIQKYRDRLQQSLRSFGRSESEAEDLASIAFVRAYERLADFRGQASFYTWLYRIALNESDHQGRRRRSASWDAVLAAAVPQSAAQLTEPDTVTAEMSRRVLYQQVYRAIACVPKPYRQMIRWHFLKGMSYERIARRMAIPKGTVMSRLFKAKDLLRQSWKRQPRSPVADLLTSPPRRR